MFENLMLRSAHRYRWNYASALLKKTFAIATLYTCLTGCLNSEPLEKETVTLRLDTPSAGWKAEPMEAWETGETLYCLFQLTPPDGMSAQVITPVVSEMRLPASNKPKKLVAIGKTWKWSSGSDVAFPQSLQSFRSQLPEKAKRVELLPPDA